MKKKRCSKCGEAKTVVSFYKNKKTKDGIGFYCKKCAGQYRKEHYSKNRKYYRNYQLKYRFGITLNDYNNLLKKQKKKCAICGKCQSQEKKAFCVDHNHKTNFVRGLLCNYCNSKLLRYLHDNKNRAIGLIRYLQSALENDKEWT